MISYKGYDSQVITMPKSAADIKPGDAVTIAQDGTVILATNSQNIIGICTTVRGEYIGVQTEGYVEARYVSTAPKCGFVEFIGDGKGAVQIAATSAQKGVFSKVLTVDTSNKIVGFIL